MIKERKKRLEEVIEKLMAEDDLPDENQSDEEKETTEKTDKENIRNFRRRSQSGLQDEEETPRRGSEIVKRESPRKGRDNSGGRRKSHEGGSHRRDSYEGDRKRRKSSAERHESSSKYRRRSDGDGGRDRHSRRDSHRSKRDDAPREVKINYDDPEMEETEEPTSKGELQVKPPVETEEEVVVPDLADIQLPEAKSEIDERKIVMPEDAEDGEYEESMDAVDE